MSDICYIDKSVKDIEAYLNDNYGSIIRWAVIDVVDNKYKISYTYESIDG